MAELDITIRAKDEASKQLQGITGHVQSMSKQFKIAGAAMVAAGAGITAALGMCVKAAAEEEAGIKRLDIAMRNMGLSYDATRESLEAWIDAQQQKTSIADDEQRTALSQLIRMTGDLAQAQDLLTVAMDMAAGTGRDLATATTWVQYAMGGNWGMVERMIPSLKKAATEEEKWMLLRQMFAGQAEEYGKTMEGQWKTMMNNISDIKEAIGSALMPVITSLLGKVSDFVKNIKDLNPELIKWGTYAAVAGVGFLSVAGGLSLILGFLPSIKAGIVVVTGLLAKFGFTLTALAGPLALLTIGLGMIAYGLYEVMKVQAEQKALMEEQIRIEEEYQKALAGEQNILYELLETRLDNMRAKVESGQATQEEIFWLEKHEKQIQAYIEACKEQKEAIEGTTKALEKQIEAQEKAFKAARKTLDLQREGYATPEAAASARAQMREFEALARIGAKSDEHKEEAAWYAQQAAMISTRLQLSSFQHGGIVPGPIGAPVPVIAHGGEVYLGSGSSRSPIQVLNNIYLDGRLIAQNVIQDLTKQVSLQGGF